MLQEIEENIENVFVKTIFHNICVYNLYLSLSFFWTMWGSYTMEDRAGNFKMTQKFDIKLTGLSHKGVNSFTTHLLYFKQIVSRVAC